MTPSDPAPAARAACLGALFPDRPPRLWCPPLTHYRDDGAIDPVRMAAHLAAIAPWVKGLLVPGSTGDGWELTPEESRAVLEVARAQAGRLGFTVLAGALRPDPADARRAIEEIYQGLAAATAPSAVKEALVRSRICGFAVCPPRGEGLSPEEIEAALANLLDLGFPLAIYQLPQVTRNELRPKSAGRLAERFGNFILFKDTSGADRVTKSGVDLAGVFRVRGAEGAYAESLVEAGGGYDGLLLSSANSFAEPLSRIIELTLAGRRAEAEALSTRLSRVVEELFEIVKSVPVGNAFANAGKAADHFMALGPGAAHAPPPRLHAGGFLPAAVIRAAGDALDASGFMPAKGYLE